MKSRITSSRRCRGGTLLFALMFCVVGGILLTSWMYLMSTRLQQAEHSFESVQRDVAWGNTAAINQQYAFEYGFRDGITRSGSTASLGSWGGSVAEPYSSMSALRSIGSASALPGYVYPFNNLRATTSMDGSVYFLRTKTTSDSGQPEHVTLYNYLKSYPSPLLGDLLLIHKRPSGVTGTVSLSNQIRVDGRVVIWEPDVASENIRAKECLSLHHTSTHTTHNLSGSALLLPQNYSATPRLTSGYGGSSNPAALTDGTLNMVNNPNFPAGSIAHIMANPAIYNGPSTGLLGQVLGLVGGVVGGIVNLNTIVPGITNPVQIQRTYLANLQLTGLQGTSLTSLIAPLNGYAGLLNIGLITVNDPNVPNLEMTGNIDLVLLVGQLTPFALNDTASLRPLIIWVDQATKPRHIIFIGESLRPIILATGPGSGQDTYVASVGVTSLLGAPLQWRLHWINEYTHLHIVPPLLFGSWQITGSLRTNWSVDTTDTSGGDKVIFKPDTDPSTLQKVLPRDAWLEPYFMVR